MEVGVKLKREYVADQLSVSTKTIARIENNELSPTLLRLTQIAKVLEVSISEILEFDAKQVFNNNPLNMQGGEYTAYNATSIKEVKELYERLLNAKDKEIELLRNG